MPHPGPASKPAPLPPHHSYSGYNSQLPPNNANRGPAAPPPSSYYHHHHQGPPLPFYSQHHQNHHYPPPHHQHGGTSIRHSYMPQPPLNSSATIPHGSQAGPYLHHSAPSYDRGNTSPPPYRHPVCRAPPPANAQIEGGSHVNSSNNVYNSTPGCTCKKSRCKSYYPTRSMFNYFFPSAYYSRTSPILFKV